MVKIMQRYSSHDETQQGELGIEIGHDTEANHQTRGPESTGAWHGIMDPERNCQALWEFGHCHRGAEKVFYPELVKEN